VRRVAWLLIGPLVLYGCADSQQDGGAGSVSTASSTTEDGSSVVSTTSPAVDQSGGGDASALDPCSTMVVDPSDFVYETYPELVELERGPVDADWLGVDGAAGCLVELTEPGGDFRAVGVEGYVFDAAVASPDDVVEGRVASSAFGVTSTSIDGTPGAMGLLREDADIPYAVALESGGVGVFVQTSASDVDPAVLVAVAQSVGGGE